MPTIVNKTFKEIAVGDAASVQRTLQAGDVRAWAAAFGEVDMLAGPGESQGAAGIVTAILTALVGSDAPGTRDLDPNNLGADQGCIADRRGDDGASGRAGEIVGSGDCRAGRPCADLAELSDRHCDPGSPGADDAATISGGGASARGAPLSAVTVSNRC